jgi:phosphopentomutase
VNQKIVSLVLRKINNSMETVRKELTNEERQANIDRLIARWKASREESRRETEERVKTPEYQAMLRELRKKNAARGIIIPEV